MAAWVTILFVCTGYSIMMSSDEKQWTAHEVLNFLEKNFLIQERAHVRAGMQQILDESMVAKALQRIAVEVLGAAAKHALPAGEWPDFLPWLAKTTQSSDASHRELAISLFGILVSYLGRSLPFSLMNPLLCTHQSWLCLSLLELKFHRPVLQEVSSSALTCSLLAEHLSKSGLHIKWTLI